MSARFLEASAIWAANSSIKSACFAGERRLNRIISLDCIRSLQWQSLAATANLFHRQSLAVFLATVKKTLRLTLRIEPETLAGLKAAAKHQNRSGAGQALHYIKEGLAAAGPAPATATPRRDFGFAAEQGPPYKLKP